MADLSSPSHSTPITIRSRSQHSSHRQRPQHTRPDGTAAADPTRIATSPEPVPSIPVDTLSSTANSIVIRKKSAATVRPDAAEEEKESHSYLELNTPRTVSALQHRTNNSSSSTKHQHRSFSPGPTSSASIAARIQQAALRNLSRPTTNQKNKEREESKEDDDSESTQGLDSSRPTTAPSSLLTTTTVTTTTLPQLLDLTTLTTRLSEVGSTISSKDLSIVEHWLVDMAIKWSRKGGAASGSKRGGELKELKEEKKKSSSSSSSAAQPSSSANSSAASDYQSPLDKLNLSRRTLEKYGLSPALINRCYVGLFTYSIGFYNSIKEICQYHHQQQHHGASSYRQSNSDTSASSSTSTSKSSLLHSIWISYLQNLETIDAPNYSLILENIFSEFTYRNELQKGEHEYHSFSLKENITYLNKKKELLLKNDQQLSELELNDQKSYHSLETQLNEMYYQYQTNLQHYQKLFKKIQEVTNITYEYESIQVMKREERENLSQVRGEQSEENRKASRKLQQARENLTAEQQRHATIEQTYKSLQFEIMQYEAHVYTNEQFLTQLNKQVTDIKQRVREVYEMLGKREDQVEGEREMIRLLCQEGLQCDITPQALHSLLTQLQHTEERKRTGNQHHVMLDVYGIPCVDDQEGEGKYALIRKENACNNFNFSSSLSTQLAEMNRLKNESLTSLESLLAKERELEQFIQIDTKALHDATQRLTALQTQLTHLQSSRTTEQALLLTKESTYDTILHEIQTVYLDEIQRYERMILEYDQKIVQAREEFEERHMYLLETLKKISELSTDELILQTTLDGLNTEQGTLRSSKHSLSVETSDLRRQVDKKSYQLKLLRSESEPIYQSYEDRLELLKKELSLHQAECHIHELMWKNEHRITRTKRDEIAVCRVKCEEEKRKAEGIQHEIEVLNQQIELSSDSSRNSNISLATLQALTHAESIEYGNYLTSSRDEVLYAEQHIKNAERKLQKELETEVGIEKEIQDLQIANSLFAQTSSSALSALELSHNLRHADYLTQEHKKQYEYESLTYAMNILYVQIEEKHAEEREAQEKNAEIQKEIEGMREEVFSYSNLIQRLKRDAMKEKDVSTDLEKMIPYLHEQHTLLSQRRKQSEKELEEEINLGLIKQRQMLREIGQYESKEIARRRKMCSRQVQVGGNDPSSTTTMMNASGGAISINATSSPLHLLPITSTDRFLSPSPPVLQEAIVQIARNKQAELEKKEREKREVEEEKRRILEGRMTKKQYREQQQQKKNVTATAADTSNTPSSPKKRFDSRANNAFNPLAESNTTATATGSTSKPSSRPTSGLKQKQMSREDTVGRAKTPESPMQQQNAFKITIERPVSRNGIVGGGGGNGTTSVGRSMSPQAPGTVSRDSPSTTSQQQPISPRSFRVIIRRPATAGPRFIPEPLVSSTATVVSNQQQQQQPLSHSSSDGAIRDPVVAKLLEKEINGEDVEEEDDDDRVNRTRGDDDDADGTMSDQSILSDEDDIETTSEHPSNVTSTLHIPPDYTTYIEHIPLISSELKYVLIQNDLDEIELNPGDELVEEEVYVSGESENVEKMEDKKDVAVAGEEQSTSSSTVSPSPPTRSKPATIKMIRRYIRSRIQVDHAGLMKTTQQLPHTDVQSSDATTTATTTTPTINSEAVPESNSESTQPAPTSSIRVFQFPPSFFTASKKPLTKHAPGSLLEGEHPDIIQSLDRVRSGTRVTIPPGTTATTEESQQQVEIPVQVSRKIRFATPATEVQSIAPEQQSTVVTSDGTSDDTSTSTSTTAPPTSTTAPPVTDLPLRPYFIVSPLTSTKYDTKTKVKHSSSGNNKMKMKSKSKAVDEKSIVMLPSLSLALKEMKEKKRKEQQQQQQLQQSSSSFTSTSAASSSSLTTSTSTTSAQQSYRAAQKQARFAVRHQEWVKACAEKDEYRRIQQQMEREGKTMDATSGASVSFASTANMIAISSPLTYESSSDEDNEPHLSSEESEVEAPSWAREFSAAAALAEVKRHGRENSRGGNMSSGDVSEITSLRSSPLMTPQRRHSSVREMLQAEESEAAARAEKERKLKARMDKRRAAREEEEEHEESSEEEVVWDEPTEEEKPKRSRLKELEDQELLSDEEEQDKEDNDSRRSTSGKPTTSTLPTLDNSTDQISTPSELLDSAAHEEQSSSSDATSQRKKLKSTAKRTKSVTNDSDTDTSPSRTSLKGKSSTAAVTSATSSPPSSKGKVAISRTGSVSVRSSYTSSPDMRRMKSLAVPGRMSEDQTAVKPSTKRQGSTKLNVHTNSDESSPRITKRVSLPSSQLSSPSSSAAAGSTTPAKRGINRALSTTPTTRSSGGASPRITADSTAQRGSISLIREVGGASIDITEEGYKVLSPTSRAQFAWNTGALTSTESVNEHAVVVMSTVPLFTSIDGCDLPPAFQRAVSLPARQHMEKGKEDGAAAQANMTKTPRKKSVIVASTKSKQQQEVIKPFILKPTTAAPISSSLQAYAAELTSDVISVGAAMAAAVPTGTGVRTVSVLPVIHPSGGAATTRVYDQTASSNARRARENSINRPNVDIGSTAPQQMFISRPSPPPPMSDEPHSARTASYQQQQVIFPKRPSTSAGTVVHHSSPPIRPLSAGRMLSESMNLDAIPLPSFTSPSPPNPHSSSHPLAILSIRTLELNAVAAVPQLQQQQRLPSVERGTVAIPSSFNDPQSNELYAAYFDPSPPPTQPQVMNYHPSSFSQVGLARHERMIRTKMQQLEMNNNNHQAQAAMLMEYHEGVMMSERQVESTTAETKQSVAPSPPSRSNPTSSLPSVIRVPDFIKKTMHNRPLR